MLMRKNVNNDVSKDSPILEPFFTVEPRYNVPLYNKELDIMNYFLRHSNRKMYVRQPWKNETLL